MFAGTPDDVTPDEFPFGASAPATTPEWKTEYTLVDSPEKWKDFLKQLNKQKRFAIDLETTGLDPLRSDIVGYAFCWEDTKGWYVAVRGPWDCPKLDPNAVLKDLKPILENPAIAKVNQNIKYDQIVLHAAGVELKGVTGDSMVAHYLLHSGERSHNLDELTRRYLSHENISITELIGKGKNQKTMADVPTAKVCAYAAEDADAAWRLANLLEADLDQSGLRCLYDTLEIPLIEVLADLEATGIRLDVPFLLKLSQDMANRLAGVEKEIHDLAGKEFNIASLKQMRDVLYKDLKLPILKRTDLSNEPSTDQETLEKLAALGHAVPKKIIEHRQVSKLKGTYVDALPALVNPRTGRIHTSFNQTVAATGRLSSSDPNLQNIPARSDMGREIRQAFLPKEGWVLLTADYSQIELRLLAHFARDEALRTAFAEGRDIHYGSCGPDFQRQGRGGHQQHAKGRKNGELRRGLRHECFRPGGATRHRTQGGRAVHRSVFRALSKRARLPGCPLEASAAKRGMSRRCSAEDGNLIRRPFARRRVIRVATRRSAKRSTWRFSPALPT